VGSRLLLQRREVIVRDNHWRCTIANLLETAAQIASHYALTPASGSVSTTLPLVTPNKCSKPAATLYEAPADGLEAERNVEIRVALRASIERLGGGWVYPSHLKKQDWMTLARLAELTKLKKFIDDNPEFVRREPTGSCKRWQFALRSQSRAGAAATDAVARSSAGAAAVDVRSQPLAGAVATDAVARSSTGAAAADVRSQPPAGVAAIDAVAWSSTGAAAADVEFSLRCRARDALAGAAAADALAPAGAAAADVAAPDLDQDDAPTAVSDNPFYDCQDE
jgi:hypothetical protein